MMTRERMETIWRRFEAHRRAYGPALANALHPLEPYPTPELLLGVVVQLCKQQDMTLDSFCALTSVLWSFIPKQTEEAPVNQC